MVGALTIIMSLGVAFGSLAQAAVPRNQAAPLPITAISVGGVPLTVEVAADPAATALGLGYRDGLTPGTGMLFVFDGPAIRSFWMKGMRFCIDVVWIEGGVVQGAAEGVCPMPEGTADADLPSYPSPVPVTYALEVPAGWFAANGIGVGAPVVGLPVAG